MEEHLRGLTIGDFHMYEGGVWSVILVVILAIAFIVIGKMFKKADPKKPKGFLLIFEILMDMFKGVCYDFLDDDAPPYVPIIAFFGIYIGIANMMPLLFGIKPPTTDINVTGALAIMAFFIIYGSGVLRHGFGKTIKHAFFEPLPALFPIMIISESSKMISLAMRLFGAITAGYVIIDVIYFLAGMWLGSVAALPLQFFFDIFDALIQTVVFMFLVLTFTKMKISH
ncbi:MAG: F0F1 ATP synthase subunit A [Culicoidibacterales bacterium]